MWHISAINTPTAAAATIYGGVPGQLATRLVGDRLGPEGASYTVTIPGVGMIELEDVGQGANAWEVLVNGTQQWGYGGEGYATITVDQGGTFTISGGVGPDVQGTVIPALDPVDVTMSDAQGFEYRIQSQSTGPSNTVSVSAQSPLSYLQFTLPAPAWGTPCTCASVSVTGPGGVVIDPDNVPAGVQALPGPQGLIFVRVPSPAAGDWTATVTCDSAMMPWYMATIAVPASETFEQAATAAYPNLPAAQAQQLAQLGILVPAPGLTHSDMLGLEGPMFDFGCAVCQAQFWAMLFIIAAIAAPYLPAWAAYVATGAEIVSHLATAISNALGVDEATAKKILDFVALVTDPTEWPYAICKAEGICS